MTLEQYQEHLRTAAESRIGLYVARAGAELVTQAEDEAKGRARSVMRVRSGNLWRSITGTTEQRGASLDLHLRAGGGDKDVSYAALQEYGGTVTPKKGKFLAIPVGPALNPAGSAKYASPRDVPDLRFVSIHGGAKGLLVRDVGGRKARTDIWYVLVRWVYVRPKSFIGQPFGAMVERAPDRMERALHDALAIA